MATSTKNGKRGNPGFIERKLAEALASFCEIDESMIESSLLNPNKSGISLKDVRLIPRIIREKHAHAIEITGTVESASFRWKWNVIKPSKKAKGIMKNISLQLKGVKIFMRPISATELAVFEARDRTSTSSLDVAYKDEQETEKTQPKFLKNILDQFKIDIEDVEVHLELPTDPGDPMTSSVKVIILSGKNIELESLGALKKEKKGRKKDTKNPLMQALRIGSLSARVVDIDNYGRKSTLPLIDPFRYSAKVNRFHGDRFASLMMGLEVNGEQLPGRTSVVPFSFVSMLARTEDERDEPDTSTTASSTTEEVEIYADHDEIETSLCRLGAVSVIWDDVNTTAFSHSESRDGDEFGDDVDMPVGEVVKLYLGDIQAIALFSAIAMFTGEPAEEHFGIGEMDRRQFLSSVIRPGGFGAFAFNTTRELNKSSLCDLPFRDIQVVLPNKAIVEARDCAFRYRTDGTRFVVEGIGGVLIDDEQVLENGSSWNVNVIDKTIVLQPKEATIMKSFGEKEAGFQMDLEGIKELALGLGTIMSLRGKVTPSTPKSDSWSLKINGAIEITL